MLYFLVISSILSFIASSLYHKYWNKDFIDRSGGGCGRKKFDRLWVAYGGWGRRGMCASRKVCLLRGRDGTANPIKTAKSKYLPCETSFYREGYARQSFFLASLSKYFQRETLPSINIIIFLLSKSTKYLKSLEFT